MPEVHFEVRFPDGAVERCYSPSSVVYDYFTAGCSYSMGDFLARSRAMLRVASARVAQKYGFSCSAAMDQLAAIEQRARPFGQADSVTIVAFDPPEGRLPRPR